MNEAKLREYAELIVKIGANVQKGQRVRLQTGVDQVQLATMVTEECYKAGASYVEVIWGVRSDQQTELSVCIRRNSRHRSDLGRRAPQTDDRGSAGPHFHRLLRSGRACRHLR